MLLLPVAPRWRLSRRVDIKVDLVDIRNSAIHQNRTLTQDEAKIALAAAEQEVDGLDPLPV
jgi:hypothetical protein